MSSGDKILHAESRSWDKQVWAFTFHRISTTRLVLETVPTNDQGIYNTRRWHGCNFIQQEQKLASKKERMVKMGQTYIKINMLLQIFTKKTLLHVIIECKTYYGRPWWLSYKIGQKTWASIFNLLFRLIIYKKKIIKLNNSNNICTTDISILKWLKIWRTL